MRDGRRALAADLHDFLKGAALRKQSERGGGEEKRRRTRGEIVWQIHGSHLIWLMGMEFRRFFFFAGNRPADDCDCSVRGKSCRFRATAGAAAARPDAPRVIGQIASDCRDAALAERCSAENAPNDFGADDAR